MTAETPEPLPPPRIASASRAEDVVTQNLAARFLATLGRDPGELRDGDPAPLGLHGCLAPEVPAATHLLPDGIAEGGIIPTLELPRRVWAGGETRFAAPLRIGDRVVRTSRVVDVTRKAGRSGALALVTIEHVFAVAGRTCVTDIQTIAYREAGAVTRPEPAPAGRPEGRVLRRLVPDGAMLFRFSAITFNAHRIHYDLGYATEVEFYPGLLVQGTLTAALLLDAAAREVGAGRVAGIAFRALAPALCGRAMALAEAGKGGLQAWSGGTNVMAATLKRTG